MMISKVDFEELFPHLFSSKSGPADDRPSRAVPAPSMGNANAMMPAAVLYAPVWAAWSMLASLGSMAGPKGARAK